MAAGAAAGRYILLILGVVLILAGLVGAVTSQYAICGPSGCGKVYYANLVGYVTNSSSGLGIPGASIVLSVSGTFAYGTHSGTAGYYQLLSIVDGGYAAQVAAAGFVTWNGSVTLGPSQATWTLNVQLASIASGGSGSGQTCSNVFTCNAPPPPPGTPAPPPPSPPTNATNGTPPTPPTTTTGFNPSPLSVMLVLFGSLFVVLAAAWRS